MSRAQPDLQISVFVHELIISSLKHVVFFTESFVLVVDEHQFSLCVLRVAEFSIDLHLKASLLVIQMINLSIKLVDFSLVDFSEAPE